MKILKELLTQIVFTWVPFIAIMAVIFGAIKLLTILTGTYQP
jgi:hypothetical protein